MNPKNSTRVRLTAIDRLRIQRILDDGDATTMVGAIRYALRQDSERRERSRRLRGFQNVG